MGQITDFVKSDFLATNNSIDLGLKVDLMLP